jgi:hypothetical protein
LGPQLIRLSTRKTQVSASIVHLCDSMKSLCRFELIAPEHDFMCHSIISFIGGDPSTFVAVAIVLEVIGSETIMLDCENHR